MTDIEEGRLAWTDSMQWSLNRINNSQLAVLNSHSFVSGGQKLRSANSSVKEVAQMKVNMGLYAFLYLLP